jgi:enoyl-CoA hydratase/carnithine racemase
LEPELINQVKKRKMSKVENQIDFDKKFQYVNVTKNDKVVHVRYSCQGRLTLFSKSLMEELTQAAEIISKQPDVNVVVLSTDGPFCSGADLNDKEGLFNAKQSFLERRQTLRVGPDMCKAWQNIEAFTIAAIEEHCIGGGAALIAALDYRILSKSAYIKLPEISLGMNMSWHTLPRLVAQIGPSLTKKYAILCEKISADEALRVGLIEECAEAGHSIKRAEALADQVGSMPTHSIRMTKASVNAAAFNLVDAIGHADLDQYLLTESTDEFKNAMKNFRG